MLGIIQLEKRAKTTEAKQAKRWDTVTMNEVTVEKQVKRHSTLGITKDTQLQEQPKT